MVLHEKRQVISDEDEDDEDISNNIDDTPSFSSNLPPVINEGNLKKFYVQVDYDQRIWVNDPPKEKNQDKF